MIEICALTKKYGNKEVLHNLNLTIGDNKIQGIVGSNGAGKTTLFNCIYQICDFEGSINYRNNLKIGYMPTDMFFYQAMKASEFIEFALIARKLKVDKSEIKAFNSIFDLPLNEYATNYSTGMKKKLLLMSILLQKNDCYLLDEPFNGLDLSSVLILKKIVLQLKERGKTVFISSHIISSLTDICDSIAFLNEGSIYKEYQPASYSSIESDILDISVDEQMKIIDQLNF